MARQTRDKFRLQRGRLLARVREDWARAEGLDGCEGFAWQLQQRVGDAVDCGAITGPENTEIQTYAVENDDSLVICVRERKASLGTQLRQVATFSIDARYLVANDSYIASRQAVERVLGHANDLLPALRALQAAHL